MDCERGSVSFGRPDRRGSPCRAISAVVVGAVVFAACMSGPQHPPPHGAARPEDPAVTDVPDAVHVVCDEGGATARDTRVRPRPRGVHIVIDNRSNAREFYIRDAEHEGWNHGGRLTPHATEDIWTTFTPGDILIGCFRRAGAAPYSVTDIPQFSQVTVVDPERLWVPFNLACDDALHAGTVDAGKVVDDPPESYEGMMREAVPGLRTTDVLVRPGYPETQWHGEPRLVVRDGKAVARLDVYRQLSRWEVRVDTCPGIDIGENGR